MSTSIYINGVKVFPMPYSNGFYIEAGKGLISFPSIDAVKAYLESPKAKSPLAALKPSKQNF